ncbi:MAG: hypothetical protein KDD33_05190 [Bdellovibrionales bacterium]|nr:hypothetical protein [Bdellovibrionales bacterium]
MKFLSLIFSFIFVGHNAFAAYSVQKCEEKAYNFVTELEEALAKAQDPPIVGDLVTPAFLKSEWIKFDGDAMTFTFEIPHQSIKNQAWAHKYHVTSENNSCRILSYEFNGATDAVTCVNRHVAEKNLKDYLAPLTGQVPVDDFPWLDEDDESSILSLSKIVEAAYSLQYNSTTESYMTGVVFTQECASAAECWGKYEVKCDGTVEAWWEGEE